MVVVVGGRPQQGQNLLMQGRETEGQGVPRSGWRTDMEELNALKTLEDPAQGGVIGWLAQLVRNGLARLNQAHAEPMLGQAVDRAVRGP